MLTPLATKSYVYAKPLQFNAFGADGWFVAVKTDWRQQHLNP